MILILFFLIDIDETTIFETEEVFDFEIILEDLEELKRNPIDINVAGLRELLKVPYLGVNDGLKILDYRSKFHYFNSVDELCKIPGFDEGLVELIKPYITVREKAVMLNRVDGRYRFQSELPYSYLGSKYYTRTRVLFNQYNVFFVTEKDPYEKNFFDYRAAGIVVDEGIRRFALGRYNLDFGDGVVLSPIGSFFNGYDFRLMMNEHGIIPYTSVMENSGFFGAAFTDSIFIRATLFFSDQRLDGTIDSSGYARSLYPSGEHTDSLAISKRDQIAEKLWGYDLRYRKGSFSLGNRFYQCYYDPAFICNDSLVDFYGKKFWISAFDLRYSSGNFYLFGEVARSFRNQLGGIFGFTSTFGFLDFNLAGKFFPAGFYSPKGAVVEDNYDGGILTLKNISTLGKFEFIYSLDNKVEHDSLQREIRLNFEKRVSILTARLQFRWRYTEEVKDLSGSKVFLRIKPLPRLFFDLRFGERYVNNAEVWEKGLFLALEGAYKTKRFVFRVRGCHYITDSYTSRVYIYEIDLPGIINNHLFYNQGNYGFVYLAFKPFDCLKLTSKYSLQFKDDEVIKKIGGQLDIEL